MTGICTDNSLKCVKLTSRNPLGQLVYLPGMTWLRPEVLKANTAAYGHKNPCLRWSDKRSPQDLPIHKLES